MAASGGLTPSELLTWIASLMGSGGVTAVLVAWLGRRAAAREPTSGPGADQSSGLPRPPPGPFGCGLADRLSIERIERIEDLAVEQARTTERIFQLLGRQHAEIADQVRRLGDRVVEKIDRGIDEGRDGRRAIEDGLRDLRDHLGRG